MSYKSDEIDSTIRQWGSDCDFEFQNSSFDHFTMNGEYRFTYRDRLLVIDFRERFGTIIYTLRVFDKDDNSVSQVMNVPLFIQESSDLNHLTRYALGWSEDYFSEDVLLKQLINGVEAFEPKDEDDVIHLYDLYTRTYQGFYFDDEEEALIALQRYGFFHAFVVINERNFAQISDIIDSAIHTANTLWLSLAHRFVYSEKIRKIENMTKEDAIYYLKRL